MSGNESLLDVRGVSYTVNGKLILDEVSLTIGRGEFVGLIGPNGAGKTTLLRIMEGISRPTLGDVQVGGLLLGRLGPKQRARMVSFMPQDSVFGFGFPVIDVLLFGRYPHSAKLRRQGQDDLEIARRMLSYVGLAGFEDRPIGELSGGERQLALFAKILVQETDLLLLDEPSANLDIRHQDQIFSMTSELAREKRAAVAAVHNLNIAAAYCTRLILMDGGRVAADGRPEEVLQPRILDDVYRVRTATSIDRSTGALTVSVAPRKWTDAGPRVHLIGGAGSAVNLTRELYRRGCRLSGGIVHEHDSDEILWKNLEIQSYTIPAFSRISDEDIAKARSMVETADVTVLCSFPVGTANVGNLRLARDARRLYIVDSTEEEIPRSFFSAEAEELFGELAATTPIVGYGEIVEQLGAEFTSS